MRKSLWIVSILLLFAAIGAPYAHADDISYVFTGAGDFAGTDFTYVSDTGYVALNTPETPTTATNLEFDGSILTPISTIEFSVGGSDIITINGVAGGSFFAHFQPPPDVFDTPGTYDDIFGDGTLSVTDLSVSTVPEINPASAPSVLALLVGAVLIIRSRRTKIQPESEQA